MNSERLICSPKAGVKCNAVIQDFWFMEDIEIIG
jgi:hypothetical protein